RIPAGARERLSHLDGQGRQGRHRVRGLRRAGDILHRRRRTHRREVRRAPRPQHDHGTGRPDQGRCPVTLVAFALTGLLAVAAPGGPQLSGPELDARTDEIGALLRCPVCQGLSVADSPATMARNMKAEVREKLAAGYDQERILADFERSYGEFVRLQPPMRGVNWLVWFGPVAA